MGNGVMLATFNYMLLALLVIANACLSDVGHPLAGL